MAIVVLVLLIIGAVLSLYFTSSYMVFAYIGAICLISICIGAFEKRKTNASELVMLASLISLAVVGRIIFTPIPNGQPATFIVIMTGSVFGPLYGAIVGVFTAAVSNVFMGQGVHTIWQMLAWGVVGMLSGVLLKFAKNIYIRAVYAFLCGFLFDYIMNIWIIAPFLKEYNISQILLTYANGFFFDLTHAISNAVFMIMFGTYFEKMLTRIKLKLKST